MNLNLREYTTSDYEDFITLSTSPEQEKYVRDASTTLKQMKELELKKDIVGRVYVICLGNAIIGYVFLKYIQTETDAWYDLHRFMIDMHFQGNGYGKKAFSMIMRLLQTCPLGKAKRVKLEYMPENVRAAHLYHTYGFVDTDCVNEYGEVTAWYGYPE